MPSSDRINVEDVRHSSSLDVENVRCSKPELLAPAGNRDAFMAALSAGADAIYLGAVDFNARRNADNFSFEELAELCDLAHLADRRIYLTLNTLILPGEMNAALDTAKAAWDAGIDALIVQDLGLMARLAEDMPQFELHASTQMNIHSLAGVKRALALGAKRVTLARELSLTEIACIAAKAVDADGRPAPLEVFAHGALCVCYSGQCLFSSLVGRRSANRGLCAQACRLPYSLIDTSTGRRIKAPGEHLLSPADLATIDILPELCAAGVASLKIEGRMKSATYVATVTRAYREALDAIFADSDGDSLAADAGVGATNVGTERSPQITSALDPSRQPLVDNTAYAGVGMSETACATEALHIPRTSPARRTASASASDALAETFSRGFTTAYLTGERGSAMMSYTRPNNQGVAVGRVSKLGGAVVAVALNKAVTVGDVLEFRTSRGRSTLELKEFWTSEKDAREASKSLGKSNSAAAQSSSPQLKADAKAEIYLQMKEAIGLGDRVFRVRNATLMDEAALAFGNEMFRGNNGIVELKASVVARLGKPLSVGFSLTRDDSIQVVSVEGEVVSAAKGRALSEDAIREHVGRIGGTAFSISSWEISLDEAVGASFSELHKLRSAALEKLTETVLAPWHTRMLVAKERPTSLAPARKGKVSVAVIVADVAGAKAALRAKADAIYIHTLGFEVGGDTGQSVVDGAYEPQALAGFSTKTPVKLLLPTIAHDTDLAALLNRLTDGRKAEPALIANNLGEIETLSELDFEIEGGQSLSATNAESLRALAHMGLKQAWISPELSCHNIAELSPTAPLPLALTVFGKQEVMITEHCLLMAQGPCDQNCVACARRKAPRLLEDRKGYKMPIRTDDLGRSHLFNAVALDLIPSMPELVALGISTMVVDATLLTTKEIKLEVERAVRARDLAVRGVGSLPKRDGYTTGHFFRGVH